MKDINTHILRLIISYASNDINEAEFNELSQWLSEDSNNKQLFSEYLFLYKKTRRISLLNTLDNDKAWDTIVSKLENPLENNTSGKDRKIRSIRPWHKYAAAAVLVGVLGTAYFFKDSLLNSRTNHIEPPGIVDTNLIEPGTDKATLTLANGEQVPLEKGTSFQTSNANSNGEQIVYEAGDRKTKELVYNYLTIPRGGQFYIMLSDGTKVWLNSESQLKYPVSFVDGKTRQVELVYGEAYFDVSSSTENNGSKFIVLNKSQEVEVLGTEFNIKAYKDEASIYTTLVEGKVKVGYDGKSQNLTPSLQLSLDIISNSASVAKVDVKSVISWKDGVFSFVEMPLKDIMKVISRWYDVDVIFENKALETVQFVGTLNKSRSIHEVLAIMKSTSLNNYEINGKTITLR
ncbi:FecR family protein [Seonamhaeicola sp.]|uniref:FecR family protein n=1 Tax=Seonamhaeicola sp. TaxID=1912245 RepID=UPI00262E0313|nr:FecR family protein [Seonamhaeicola sp.]